LAQPGDLQRHNEPGWQFAGSLGAGLPQWRFSLEFQSIAVDPAAAGGRLASPKKRRPLDPIQCLATYQPGDTIVVTARGSEAPLLITGGDGNVIRDVDVYSSGAIGVHLDSVSNATVDHVRVMPRPGTDRLIGANADGIHSELRLGQQHRHQLLCEPQY